METIQPWIIKQITQGPLEHYIANESQPTASVLPLKPFRGQRVQFIKFLTHHEWGTHQDMWAEASDRHVTILVHIPSEMVTKFERDQMADKRCFSQLGYPTFSLGGCRWALCNQENILKKKSKYHHHHNQHSPINNQLCIQVVPDLEGKNFRLGTTAAFTFPPFNNYNNNNNHTPKKVHLLHFSQILQTHPLWILLNKRLQVTLDPSLLITGARILDKKQHNSNLQAQIAIPYTGPSRRVRALKARDLQKNVDPSICEVSTIHETNHRSNSSTEFGRRGNIHRDLSSLLNKPDDIDHGMNKIAQSNQVQQIQLEETTTTPHTSLANTNLEFQVQFSNQLLNSFTIPTSYNNNNKNFDKSDNNNNSFFNLKLKGPPLISKYISFNDNFNQRDWPLNTCPYHYH